MCADVGHYSAILSRNPSTSSSMFGEKNFGKSVDDGVRDRGGMCCKAFLDEGQHTNNQSQKQDRKIYIKKRNCLQLALTVW